MAKTKSLAKTKISTGNAVTRPTTADNSDQNLDIFSEKTIKEGDWVFTPKAYAFPRFFEKLAHLQADYLTNFKHSILEMQMYFDWNEGLALKILSDCHKGSRVYSVFQWILVRNGIFERETTFVHTDDNSIFEGGEYFDQINLQEQCERLR